jgi:uncharacterized protein YcbK (DUF882 family)
VAPPPLCDSYYGRNRRNPTCPAGHADASYRLRAARWRTPDPSLEAPEGVGRYREFRLRSVHGGDRIDLVPFDEAGALTDDAREAIARVFCGGRGCEGQRVDDRLVRVLYVLSLHFRASEIVVVSGFRSPEDDGRTSNHHHGRAVDVIVPGIPNDEVAAYLREFGRLGVGYYPTSGFVHVDVRERSFFWVDPSGPGEPICTQAVLPEVAREVDESFDARYEDPRRWSPVPMPADPEDGGGRPETAADRLDDLDDEAAMAALFEGVVTAELAAAEAAVRGEERRAEQRRRTRAAAAAAETPAAEPMGGIQTDASNAMAPPTTVAATPPGTS